MRRNTLYYGDNLDILRAHIPDESVDLIYLDPPFNSRRSYNVLFKEAMAPRRGLAHRCGGASLPGGRQERPAHFP